MVHLADDAADRLIDFVERLGSLLESDSQRRSFAAYSLGLLSDGERKSMEPMAARLCPEPAHVDAMHQRLHHFIANGDWSDRAVRKYVAAYALGELEKRDPVRAWIIDDTGMLKQGKHSVGVQRQYTGSAGKVSNSQVAVSLSVSTLQEHVPIDVQLYLPKTWTSNSARRRKAKIPKEVRFRTKTQIALEMIEQALKDGITHGILLADASYGRSGEFRDRARELGLEFIVAVDTDTLIWPIVNGEPTGNRRVRAEEYSASLKFNSVTWREDSNKRLAGKFAVAEVRIERDGETMILIAEHQTKQSPKIYLAALDGVMSKQEMIRLLKERWRTERIYQDLKGELGFDHFEGRTYPGWNHHVSVVLACFAFVAVERSTAFPPSAEWAGEDRTISHAAGAPFSRFLHHHPACTCADNRLLAPALSVLPQ